VRVCMRREVSGDPFDSFDRVVARPSDDFGTLTAYYQWYWVVPSPETRRKADEKSGRRWWQKQRVAD
jgi:hypothetical protein